MYSSVAYLILLVVFFQWLPFFVEAALERLTREVKESELRTMCLQVVRQYPQKLNTTIFMILKEAIKLAMFSVRHFRNEMEAWPY